MEQCTLFWVVLAGFAMLTTLIIIGIICLHRLAEIKELWDRVRDKLASNETRLNKFDAAVEWFLQKEGMKLDSTYSGRRWFVTPADDCHLRDWLARTDDRKREALAKALYEANLQAMRDFDKEQRKETKKK